MTGPDAALDSVTTRLERIRGDMAAACEAAGRDRSQVTLVGACKRQPLDRLVEAHRAGLRCFGENIVQEGLRHRDQLPDDIEWHLIGPLQSNKANKAVQLFSWVHSIDRPKIARVLDRAAGQAGVEIQGLLEVNLGREASKHGFDPASLIDVARGMIDFENLRIVGLMAIPPYESDVERSRDWFRQLRALRDELFSLEPWADRPGCLSMGMSSDYRAAIEEGATHIRVGTNLFGARSPR